MIRILLAPFLCLLAFSLSAQISVNPPIVNFFTVFQTQTDSIDVTLTNNYATAYIVSDISFFHTDAFWVDQTSFSIPAGGSHTVKVYCDPLHNIRYRDFMLVHSKSHPEVANAFIFAAGKYLDSYWNLTEDKWHEDLKGALTTMISFGTVDLGYTGARDQLYLNIDNEKNNGQGAAQNTVECVYTGTTAVGWTNRQDAQTNYGFNTEHTFPQAMFNSNNPMVGDLHHLFPVTSSSNSERSNNPFGVVSNPNWSVGGSKSNGNTFEPRDEQKGSAARSLFYMVLRYQDYNNFVAPQEPILRQWLQSFPPDSIEIQRNADIYALQNNLNPFVDHPEFLDRISSITGTASATPAAALHNVADTLFYGSASLANGKTGTLIISNQGDADLTLSNFSFSDPAYSIIGSPSMTIPVDSERVLLVDFQPATSNTVFTGTFTFQTNDPNNSTASIVLTGDSYPVGIRDNEIWEGVQVFPVPANEILQIQLPEISWEPVSIELLSLEGRIVRSMEMEPGFRKTGMDLADVPAGVYLLHVAGPTGKVVKKVLVN